MESQSLKQYQALERARNKKIIEANALRYLAQKKLNKENERGNIICTLNAIAGSFIFCALFGIASGLN